MKLLVRLLRWIDVRRGAWRCTVCGCTDSYACEGGCSWASINPLVCSACHTGVHL